MRLAAAKARREVVVVGRAIRRMIDVAGELGMLAGLPPFLDEEAFQHLPRNKVLALLTGSQGEARAALARIAADDHRNVGFDKGDLVVFSSRAIPGNEVPINRIINSLVKRGVRVMTDRDRLVHVSGHPRREEMRHLYGWLKPRDRGAGPWRGDAPCGARRTGRGTRREDGPEDRERNDGPPRAGCRRASSTRSQRAGFTATAG